MLLEQHLLQLFGNLPYLPKAKITKHLDDIDSIKASLVSENWDRAIECHQKQKKKRRYLAMHSKHNRVEMTVFDLDFSKPKHLIIDFPVESVLENSAEIVEDGDRVICRSENFADFENRILATFHKLRTWFRVKTSVIRVNMDLGFNLEFLKKLRLQTFEDFELSGDKKNCQIDGKELSDLMKTWNIKLSVQIKIETIGKFEGKSRMLRGLHCEFTDSRWITGDMLSYRCSGLWVKFKKCVLTSEDFNQLFKRWIDKRKYDVGVMEFHLEHELDVEKVFEGLEAKKWNPKERGRIYRVYHGEDYTFTDLADGLDLYRSDGELATIHISTDKKIIKFFGWNERFPLLDDKKNLAGTIRIFESELERLVWSERKRAELIRKIEKYQGHLQIISDCQMTYGDN